MSLERNGSIPLTEYPRCQFALLDSQIRQLAPRRKDCEKQTQETEIHAKRFHKPISIRAVDSACLYSAVEQPFHLLF